MHVYSKKIIQFVLEIKNSIKQILAKEVGLRIYGDRFYDRLETSSYPIKVVIFNNKNKLGYFDSQFYELGFNERLMHGCRKQLINLIRHELAHYITFINHQEHVQAHGIEFRAFCDQMGWNEEVYRASMCLDSEDNTPNLEESAILRKVQKLMALSKSSNANEAELAMIKAQELLLKHNIETKYLDSEEEEKMCLMRILHQKKETAKMRAIARILETFFVTTVYNRGDGFTCLEIMGTAVNVEIAEYVAQILDPELEHLWNVAKKQAHLKGALAKNSFFMGISKGYCNKIQALKREYHQDVLGALMVIEKKLLDAKNIVYPRLIHSRSSRGFCPESSALGEKMGKQLNIKAALGNSKAHSFALIS